MNERNLAAAVLAEVKKSIVGKDSTLAKVLVAILAREKDRPAIMQAIARTLRLEGKEGGSVFSLPVEAVEGLSEG